MSHDAVIDPQHEALGAGSAQLDYVQLLWRRRWLILLFTVLGVIAAGLLLSRQVPIYQSSSKILVQQQEILDKRGVVFSQGRPFSELQAELIRSPQMVNLVARRSDVQDLQLVREAGENVASVIQSGLKLGIDRDFVTIFFESPYASDNAVIANAIVDTYVTFLGDQRKGSATSAVETLARERHERDLERQDKQRAALAFKKRENVLSFNNERGNIILNDLATISAKLTDAKSELIEARADLSYISGFAENPVMVLQIAELRADGLNPMSSDLMFHDDQELQVQLEALESSWDKEMEQARVRIERMRRVYAPDHPEMIDAERDLELLSSQLEIRRQALLDRQTRREERRERQLAEFDAARRERAGMNMQEMAAAYIAAQERSVARAEQRVNEFQQQFDEKKQMAFDMNQKAAEYATIEADVIRLTELVESIDRRMLDIDVSENTGMVNVTILDVAAEASAPIRPDPQQFILSGLAIGLMLGFGSALGLGLLDQRLRSVEEVAAAAGSAVLGIVPQMPGSSPPAVRGRRVLLEPTSDVAESFRAIRTALHFNTRGGAVRVVLVTSPTPGDGKSTTVSNLALALAQSGRKTLVIDADCRRPMQHKIFDFAKDEDGQMIGLASIIDNPHLPLSSLAVSTGIERLSVIPVGPILDNPAAVLNDPKFAKLIEEARLSYDMVLIDSPPVVPVADARILASMCDATVLVLRAEKSTKRMTRFAVEGLTGVGAKIAGVIVNAVPRRKDRYGYYYGYGYGYRYYHYGNYAASGATNGAANGSNGSHATNGAGNGQPVTNGTRNGQGTNGDHANLHPEVHQPGRSDRASDHAAANQPPALTQSTRSRKDDSR